MKHIAKILAFGLLAPSLLFAQSTNTVNIAIEGKSIVDIADDDARINLLGEAFKQYPELKANGNLEISMVRFEAKSGVGGAQFFLRVNNSIVDGAVVETNSKLKDPQDTTTFVQVELKNIDRNPLTEASIMLQSLSKLKIRNIQLVLGAPSEPAIFGHYADQQASQVGGGVADGQASEDEKVTATPEQISAVFERYYGETVESTLVTEIKAPVVTMPVISGGDCLVSAVKGAIICTGGIVSERYNGQGTVSQVILSSFGEHQVTVKFAIGGSTTTAISQLTVIDSGSSGNKGASRAASCFSNSLRQSLCVGQVVLDRNSQQMTIRDVESFRNQIAVRIESRYGQSFYTSANSLTAMQNQSPVGYNNQNNNQGNSRDRNQGQTNVGQQRSLPPVAYDARRCVSDKRSRQTFCVGTRVTVRTNAGMRDGYIINVKNKAMGRDTVDVRFDMGATLTYRLDEVFKK